MKTIEENLAENINETILNQLIANNNETFKKIFSKMKKSDVCLIAAELATFIKIYSEQNNDAAMKDIIKDIEEFSNK